MAGVGFRWLDILEKEFDKAFVDLDITIGELDAEEPDVVYNVRQKMSTLSSCFAQLTHKAQTIFQNSAKIEAELIHMRAELIDSKSKRELMEQELHTLLLQLHSAQLSHLPGLTSGRVQDSKIDPDATIIKKKLQEELKKSPSHRIVKEDEIKFSTNIMEISRLRAENAQLQSENTSLRNSILTLNSEVYGAKLAAKYLDKELAGRIQQLQLLGKEMRGETRDKLWRQLESEILLQRHKTVVKACRQNSNYCNSQNSLQNKPDITLSDNVHTGNVRNVVVKRKSGQGLGISITGGREHGVPILISELESNGPAALCGNLYVGDAILSVNSVDLRQACHREAVDILQKQTGDCVFEVQYIAADDSDNSLSEDGYNFHYRFFDPDVDVSDSTNQNYNNHCVLNTPTAPRTPESQIQSRRQSQPNSRSLTPIDPKEPTSNYNQLSRQELSTVDLLPNRQVQNVTLVQPIAVSDNLIELSDDNNSEEIYDTETQTTTAKIKIEPKNKNQNNNFSTKTNITPNQNDNQNIFPNVINNDSNLTLTKNPTKDSHFNNFRLENDMIDLLNSNKNITEKTVDNIVDSPNKKIISDLGTILFESILEPLLYPTTIFNENDFSCFDDNLDTSERLDNRSNFKNEENFNVSTNSLVSENLSSPMQTSTDNMVDSELASNDSQSPKTMQKLNGNGNIQSNSHGYGHSLLEIKKFNEFCSEKPHLYSSNESLSNPKSDQSLLNSAESCDSSPVHKFSKEYVMRKAKKHKTKKNFGVKTLQAIFGNKNDGYSDISSTNSDYGDDCYVEKKNSLVKAVKTDLESIEAKRLSKTTPKPPEVSKRNISNVTVTEIPKFEKPDNDDLNNSLNMELSRLLSKPILTEISPQFEKNIHTFLSETFERKPIVVQNVQNRQQTPPEASLPNFVSNKKYFMLHGQNLRVGKALRLCPNETEGSTEFKIAQREKLLARYVYNTNSVNVDGVGDPDFGTPV